MRAPALLLLAALALAACAPGSAPAARATPRPTPAPGVYVAIGASETIGIGTDDPIRQAFPQQLYQRLDLSTVMYDFGLPGETTEAALRDELGPALAVHPTLATVWLNVDDLVAGVAVADYEVRLEQIVSGLRAAGVRVLLANTPHLDRLPAYAACRPNPPAGPPCPLGAAVTLPPPDRVEALVTEYNAAIARVAARQGAVLVDLYAAGEVPVLHPEYVGRDGFHPSAAGASAIAGTFATALGLTAPAGG
jgi:lysophospholipase L1-like esterase